MNLTHVSTWLVLCNINNLANDTAYFAVSARRREKGDAVASSFRDNTAELQKMLRPNGLRLFSCWTALAKEANTDRYAHSLAALPRAKMVVIIVKVFVGHYIMSTALSGFIFVG